MDIGPIAAIRPVAMIRPSPAAPDPSHVYEVEYLGQSSDDEYTASKKAARGLEDEGDDPGKDSTECAEEQPLAPERPSQVNFFA
jgi:hypothetical protein